MLDNLSLADRFATIHERKKEIEAQYEALRKEILATGQEVVAGEFADAVVRLSERTNFDAKLAKSFLNAEQIAACTSKSVVNTVVPKAKTAEG
jgi:hypothetical protein